MSVMRRWVDFFLTGLICFCSPAMSDCRRHCVVAFFCKSPNICCDNYFYFLI